MPTSPQLRRMAAAYPQYPRGFVATASTEELRVTSSTQAEGFEASTKSIHPSLHPMRMSGLEHVQWNTPSASKFWPHFEPPAPAELPEISVPTVQPFPPSYSSKRSQHDRRSHGDVVHIHDRDHATPLLSTTQASLPQDFGVVDSIPHIQDHYPPSPCLPTAACGTHPLSTGTRSRSPCRRNSSTSGDLRWLSTTAATHPEISGRGSPSPLEHPIMDEDTRATSMAFFSDTDSRGSALNSAPSVISIASSGSIPSILSDTSLPTLYELLFGPPPSRDPVVNQVSILRVRIGHSFLTPSDDKYICG